MDFKKIFDNRNEIINGHINELRSKIGMTNPDEEAVFEIREKICLSCPLKIDNTCDPSTYLNPKTLETAKEAKEGFISGCGCRLSAKQKSRGSECPAGFWGGEFN